MSTLRRNYREAEVLAMRVRKLRSDGFLQREIAAFLGITRETVAYYLTRAKAMGRIDGAS
jgi:DNA-binding CsgD family transcriptional regulator